MTYETKKNAKNAAFFYKERKRMQRTQKKVKNAKNAAVFYKERKRTQRMPHSFTKNAKESKNVAFF